MATAASPPKSRSAPRRVPAVGVDLVNIHAHVLPGLDDGPADMDASLQMCTAWAAQGVRTVVATPHMADGRYNVPASAVRSGVAELNRACAEREIDLEIRPGGDVRIVPELPAMLAAGDVLTLGEAGTHLLVEFPGGALPPLHGLAGALRTLGVVPVVSHPERHGEFQRRPERLRELVRLGCLIQLTTGSLLGRLGRGPRRLARWMLANDLVHVLADDAHAPEGRRRPDMGEAAALVSDLAGPQRVDLLCRIAPASLLRPSHPSPSDPNFARHPV